MTLKIKNKRYQHLFHKLSAIIKDSKYKNKVYVSGETLAYFLAGKTPYTFEMTVDIVNGSAVIGNWLAIKTGCMVLNQNPIVDNQSGISILRLTNDNECNDIIIVIREMKMVEYSSSPARRFGTMSSDATLRSVSLNALYYSFCDNLIYDPLKYGFKDTDSKTVRCAITPDIYFRNEPSNILALIREASELGYGICLDTWLSIVKNAHRVITSHGDDSMNYEFKKILQMETPSIALRRMLNSGVMHFFCEDMADENGISCKFTDDLFEYTVDCMDKVSPNHITRLAAMYHGMGFIIGNSPASQFNVSADVAGLGVLDFGLSLAEAERVSNIITSLNYLYDMNRKSAIPERRLKKFISSAGKDLQPAIEVLSAMNCCRNDIKENHTTCVIKAVMSTVEKMEKEKIQLPVNGFDIQKELKVAKGPLISKCLDAIRAEFEKNPSMTRDDCLSVAEHFYSVSTSK